LSFLLILNLPLCPQSLPTKDDSEASDFQHADLVLAYSYFFPPSSLHSFSLEIDRTSLLPTPRIRLPFALILVSSHPSCLTLRDLRFPSIRPCLPLIKEIIYRHPGFSSHSPCKFFPPPRPFYEGSSPDGASTVPGVLSTAIALFVLLPALILLIPA